MNNDNHYYMSQNDICMFNMCPDFCPARPAGMSCYTGFSRTSRTKIRTNRTPGNPGVKGVGWGGCYDQLCCPASLKLLLGLDLGLGCDNFLSRLIYMV